MGTEEKKVTVVKDERALPASKKIINAKLVTVIPNSRAEHSIYTYSTKADTHFDIKDEEFFNPLYTFIMVGDMIRVFRFEGETLVTYYEFIVTEVDKIAKKVTAVTILEKNLQKAKES
jgi:hypothetical protein